MKRQPAQPALFEPPKQVRYHEKASTYRAVVALRKRGCRVYRNGLWHVVNGRRIATLKLIEMAGRRA